MSDISRRQFLQSSVSLAGGMLLGFHLPVFAKASPYEATEITGSEINAWLAIEPDESIIIRVAQSEMGQGVMTALPMIVADELEADWRNVRVEYADVNRHNREQGVYGAMGTGGSQAVRRSRPYLQQAGAEAREKLIKAAAETWGVDPADCYADYGEVHHKPDRRKVKYGQIAKLAAEVSVANVKIKSPEDFSLMGLPTKRLDTPAKVDGSAIFGMDVRVPDMVYAAVTHCPVLGGKVRGLRYNAVRNMPGVLGVVRMETAVAIAAETYWQAAKAIEALPVQWDTGEEAKTYTETFRSDFYAALNEDGVVIQDDGKTRDQLEVAEKTIASDYLVPYLAHAAMEPLNCTVHVTQTRVDIWAGVQNPQSVVEVANKLTGVAVENIYVHNCFLGGGFGRRSNTDFVEEAIQIAAEIGRPVQMIWSREDDMRGGQYRPMSAMRFIVGLDLDNNIIAYENHSVTHSILQDIKGEVPGGVDSTSVEGLANMPYKFAPRRITHTIKNTQVPTWWWRSVGSSQNAFAMECFIDELAEASGMDPIGFRRKYLSHRPDLLAVLDELEQQSGWNKRLPSGVARGVAIHESFGTIVGAVVELSLNSSGGVKVHRVVSVVDCGNLVNPQIAKTQIESGVVYGLSAALFGKITIEKGKVLENNFDTYRVLGMKDTPKMETHFLLSGGDKWGGLGEPGVPCVAPAVVNAIHKITRRRMRSLPVSDYYLQPGRA